MNGALPLASRLLEMAFVRFCIIGAVGFLVDASVLTLLIHGAGIPALEARLASFAGAVLVTFELNRRWTFREAQRLSYRRSLATYLGVQCLGFTCNFAVYAGLYILLRPAGWAPLVALAGASAVALILNYLGARLMVFRRLPDASRSNSSCAKPNASEI